MIMEMKFEEKILQGHCPHCNTFHLIDTKQIIQTPFKCIRFKCDGCGAKLEPFVKCTGKLFIQLTRDLWLYTDNFGDKDVDTFLYISTYFTSKNSTRRIKSMVYALNLGDMRV